MRALTLYQPWASLVAVGAKTIETRSWGTRYRGPLLIHAAKKWGTDQAAAYSRACRDLIVAGWRDWPVSFGEDGRHRGCVVAACRLADCRPMPDAPRSLDRHFGTFGPGRYGWVLVDVRPLPTPVPWPGAMGLWSAPPGLIDLVTSQVGEVRP